MIDRQSCSPESNKDQTIPKKLGPVTRKTALFSMASVIVSVLVHSAMLFLLPEKISGPMRWLFAIFTAISAGAAAAVFFARKLNAPLLTLARFISEHDNHPNDRISLATRDEIAEMADAWNQRLDELKHHRQQVASTNRELVETARQAGMAEVTVGVLHNVGNVLNSLGVTLHSLRQKINHSRISGVDQVAALFSENEGQLHNFLTHDSRGRKLPEYLSALSLHLSKEKTQLLQYVDELEQHLNHTRDIIHLQQSYSRSIGLTEAIRIKDLVADALQLNMNSILRHQIRVEQQIEDLPPCLLDRHKVMQILANLIQNAREALIAAKRPDKVLNIGVSRSQPDRLRISITDNGMGISRKNLKRIFGYGFTTRKDGHGFGLHSGALTARELKGTLEAKSDGPGCGATFILELPFRE